MPRPLLLLLLLALPACQGDNSRQSASMAGPADNFDPATVQTYDIQTEEYHQQPPFGARADRGQ
jgi:hypothetical protein